MGTDLQDLYGIDPAHIGDATSLANAYFANGSARATLDALAAQRDGVLVSAETANDYQLRPGDTVNLRLQNAQDQQYHIVPFRFIGIVRDFPTAPKELIPRGQCQLRCGADIQPRRRDSAAADGRRSSRSGCTCRWLSAPYPASK